MGVSSGRVHEIAMATGIGHLTVYCALTPIYEGRAIRAIGRSGVERIRAIAEGRPVATAGVAPQKATRWPEIAEEVPLTKGERFR